MRLHFWAAREAGLLDVPAFKDWYSNFIGEFSGVYESSAPSYAKRDREWSSDPARIIAYREAGNVMTDLTPLKTR